MEFFRNVNVDWMGKAKYFVALSAILLVVGWISIFTRVSKNPGAMYGIDFRGGTLVYVRFAGKAPIDQIRDGLRKAGLPNSTIQSISDTQAAGSQSDVVIGLEQNASDESLDAGKQKILDVLHSTFGTQNAGNPDFNSITPSALAADLTQKDPLGISLNAGDRYNQLANQLTAARDKDHGGIRDQLQRTEQRAGSYPRDHDDAFEQLFARYVCDTRRGDRWAQGRRTTPPPGFLRNSLCLGGHAGVYCVPLRVGIWGCGCHRRLPRRADHAGFLFAFSLRDFADGDCGIAHSGRLFDERYDCDLRSRARKSAADEARAASRMS